VPEMNSSSAGEGSDIGKPHGKDRLLLAHGALELARDEGRVVRGLRQHEHEGPGAFDAPDDLVAVRAPGLHIARRYPASEAAGFEPLGNGLGFLRVSLGVADEGREKDYFDALAAKGSLAMLVRRGKRSWPPRTPCQSLSNSAILSCGSGKIWTEVKE
jgi:hypothetical protein